MHRRGFLLLVCCIALACPSPIPEGLVGTVTNMRNGEPIPGARIVLTNFGNLSAFTNTGGLYTIASLPPGTYTVEASADGFESATKQVTIINGRGSSRLDFALAQESVGEGEGEGEGGFEPIVCESFATIMTQLVSFKSAFGIAGDDFDGDLLPEDAALALMENVVCADDGSPLWGATLNALDLNLIALDGEAQLSELALFREVIAAIMAVSVNTQIVLKDELQADLVVLLGTYESVRCLSAESCTPALSPGLSLAEGYEVHEGFEKGVNEPYAGPGDLDFDLTPNATEWSNVVAVGGMREAFVTAATDPTLNGAEQPGEGEGEGEGEGGLVGCSAGTVASEGSVDFGAFGVFLFVGLCVSCGRRRHKQIS